MCVRRVQVLWPGDGGAAFWITTEDLYIWLLQHTGPAPPQVHHMRTRPRGTYCMKPTFEVSVKLSGWLNFEALANIPLHQAAGADVCVRRVRGGL